MHILYLTEFLSAIGGGGEVMFRDFAVALANRGHTVDILCHQSEDFLPSMNGLLTIHKIPPPVRLEHGHFPSCFQQASFILKLVVKGAEIVKHDKIDIIHANTLSPAFAGSILGMLYDIPVINTVHHVYSVKRNEYSTRRYQRRSGPPFNLFSLPKFLCEKAIVRLPTDKIVTVSESSRVDLMLFGVACDKITIVPNAIDLNFIDHHMAIHDLQYANFALFIGRLVEYKNLKVIIEAFKDVVYVIPDSRLVIAGDGPEYQKWKEIVSSKGLSHNIVFEGYVSENRKDELLRCCSMLLFPSIIEGFGIVLLEAFARRKPVIVSDVKPLTEIVDDNVDGFIVSAASPRDWAEKMVLLLTNKSRCEEMGARGRSKVESRFNIFQVARSLESIYDEVIAKTHDRLKNLEATI